MKIYISGKMTGLPDLGRRHFENTEEALRSCGHVVLNPAVLPAGMAHGDYMPICLAMLDAADAVYMLHNWRESDGARLERAYAAYRGKRVIEETDAKARDALFRDGRDGKKLTKADGIGGTVT